MCCSAAIAGSNGVWSIAVSYCELNVVCDNQSFINDSLLQTECTNSISTLKVNFTWCVLVLARTYNLWQSKDVSSSQSNQSDARHIGSNVFHLKMFSYFFFSIWWCYIIPSPLDWAGTWKMLVRQWVSEEISAHFFVNALQKKVVITAIPNFTNRCTCYYAWWVNVSGF